MLYIAYLPKTKGEPKESRKINCILDWYMSITEYQYSVIAAPGYLSRGENTIKEYIKNLSDILTNGSQNIKIGFLNGMNGHYISTSGNIIIDEHNDNLSHNHFERIILNPKNERDHRKMLCFYKDDKHTNEIKLESIDEFLKTIKVDAILIGSSNQSYTTYFNDTASKGEADIFMFVAPENSRIEKFIYTLKGKDYNPDINQKWIELFDDIVITESFYGKGHENSQEFFKDILKDILVSGLKEQL